MEVIHTGATIALLAAFFTLLHVVVIAGMRLAEDIFDQFGWIGCGLAGILYCVLGLGFMPLLICYLIMRACCCILLPRD
jgi:hypothetical protein